jgi:hypothetical protein
LYTVVYQVRERKELLSRQHRKLLTLTRLLFAFTMQAKRKRASVHLLLVLLVLTPLLLLLQPGLGHMMMIQLLVQQYIVVHHQELLRQSYRQVSKYVYILNTV